MIWINKSGRDKNQVFTCSNCRKDVYFIDGESRTKYSAKKSVCRYPFCPWCKAGNDDAFM